MGNSGTAKTSIKPNPITALIDPEKKASINAVTSEINKRIYSVAESFFIFMPIGNYIIIVAPPDTVFNSSGTYPNQESIFSKRQKNGTIDDESAGFSEKLTEKMLQCFSYFFALHGLR